MKMNGISRKANENMLYFRAADTVRNYIIHSNLQVGDKLPSERQLSEQLGISRNSVREALRFLENQRLISVKAGVGSFVERKMTDDSTLLQFLKVNFTELLQVKAILELSVMKEFTEGATEEQMEELLALAAEMKEVAEKGEYPAKLDARFHKTLVSFSSNKTLRVMVSEILEELDSVWIQVRQDFAKMISTIPLHMEMVLCMQKRDYPAAKKLYDEICRIDIEILEENQFLS